MRPTKVVFPNGSIDPWHALSFTTNVDPKSFTTIYIDGKLYILKILDLNTGRVEFVYNEQVCNEIRLIAK
jgi:hypothetical protein